MKKTLFSCGTQQVALSKQDSAMLHDQITWQLFKFFRGFPFIMSSF